MYLLKNKFFWSIGLLKVSVLYEIVRTFEKSENEFHINFLHKICMQARSFLKYTFCNLCQLQKLLFLLWHHFKIWHSMRALSNERQQKRKQERWKQLPLLICYHLKPIHVDHDNDAAGVAEITLPGLSSFQNRQAKNSSLLDFLMFLEATKYQKASFEF